jgi:hypothetical protein
MLSTFRKTAIGSIAALSLALVGASAPAAAQMFKGGGGGGGGFHGGGGFSGGGAFKGGGFSGGSGFSAGSGFSGGSAFKPTFNGGAFHSATAGNFGASSGFQGKPDPGVIAGGDWHHHHHDHDRDHDRFHGFAPFGFAYYGGYPYYDNSYAYDYSYDSCIEYRHVYDRYGHYLGDRPVNVC